MKEYLICAFKGGPIIGRINENHPWLHVWLMIEAGVL